MKVIIVGAGYVGLVTGVCLSEIGHDVSCIESDLKKVENINRGEAPFFESGLNALLTKNLKSGKFKAVSNIADAIRGAEISIIAVGTPFKDDGIDLSYVKTAAEQIGKNLHLAKSYHVVCVKSTVIPGTTENIVLPIIEQASGKKSGKQFGICMNPEFLAEGEAVNNFMKPDRIVIGSLDQRTTSIMKGLYGPLEAHQIEVSPTAAELSKYTCNSFLATLISFSNEIANLCSRFDNVDSEDIFEILHYDHRVTPIGYEGSRHMPGITAYIKPGAGFGGSCFPKDLLAITAKARNISQPMPIIESVFETNSKQVRIVIDLVSNALKHGIIGSRVGVLGLSFKPGTDDLRESQSIALINQLLNQGCKIYAHDPMSGEQAQALYENTKVTVCKDIENILANVDVVVVMTSWPEYKEREDEISLANLPVVDPRGYLSKNKFNRYFRVGLSPRS